MTHTRRRFLTAIGSGGVLAGRALMGQTARPPLPSVELGEALEFVAIRNVTVIDMTGKPPMQGVTVLLDGSRIASVGVPARVVVPSDATVLDGTGKFLIPGLWDMHAHPTMHMLPLFVANGVTGVRCMNAPSRLIDLRAEIESNRRLGPAMVVGLYLDGPGPSRPDDNWQFVSTVEKARAAVRRGRREGYDFIKVYNLLPRESYFAIIEEAREQALLVAGHVPWRVTPAECSNAGQKSIEHTFAIQRICVDGYEEWRQSILHADPRILTDFGALQHNPSAASSFAAFAPNVETFQLSRAASLARTMRKNKTWLCPTLTASLGLARDPHNSDDPRLKFVGRGVKAAWERSPMAGAASNRRSHDQYLEIVRMFHKAGVAILAGSDVSMVSVFTFPGFSLHEELQLLVSAGLKPLEALRAATSGPAEFFGKLDVLGTVEPRRRAELVLLDADPLDNISNTQRINAVFTGGRMYRRPALDKLLEFAETDAQN